MTHDTHHPPARRTLRDYAGITLRGFLMGSADVVPGVSGGTIAFIVGIYEELLDSIRAFSEPSKVKLILTLRWREALQTLPWQFLLALGLGIGLAVLTLARGLSWLLDHQAVYVWAFFFGLVLASAATVSRQLKQWSWTTLAALAAGAVGAYIVVGLVPVQTPDAWWFLILSGSLAICAMILPGISGAFILVLLGKYHFVLNAVNQRDVLSLGLVGLGCAIGLLSFARVVSFLFKRFHATTVAALIGLMLGSLRKIWPWKVTLQTIVDRHGELIPIQEANVLPAGFTSEVAVAALLAIAGFAVVVGIDFWASQAGGKPTHRRADVPAQENAG